jgi:hypothetical protein
MRFEERPSAGQMLEKRKSFTTEGTEVHRGTPQRSSEGQTVVHIPILRFDEKV